MTRAVPHPRVVRLSLAIIVVTLLLCVEALAWEQVPGTRLEQVNPCPANDCAYSGQGGFGAIVENWNGAAIDQDGARLFLYGGGHRGYWGNEVYALDLRQWRWSRLSEPSIPGESFDDPEAEKTGRMADGSPRVPHTYDSLVYEPTLDALLAIGAPGTSPRSIRGHSRVDRFDVATGRWVESLTPAKMSGYWLGGTARDDKTGLIWVHTSGPSQLASYDPRKDIWKNYRRKSLPKGFVVEAGDGKLLMLGGCGQYTCNHWLQDLRKPNKQPLKLAKLEPLAATDAPGLAYNTKLKRFAAYVNGALYHIDPRDGAYEWVANGPPSTRLGVYGRFAYAQALDAYVYVAATDEDVWVRYLDRAYPNDGTPPVAARDLSQASPGAATKRGESGHPASQRKVQPMPVGQDWATRSTGKGVVLAIPFDRPEQVTPFVVPDAKRWTNGQKNVSWTPAGMRMDILRTDARQHGNWRHCLLPRCADVEPGQTIYIAHSQYFDEPMVTQHYRGEREGREASGFKQTIISRQRKSAQPGEIVLTNIGQRGYPQAYRKHRGKTADQFGGLNHQPAVRGGPRYRDKIRFRKLPRGFKGVAYPLNDWLHFKQVVEVVSRGRAYYSLYAAHSDEQWVALIENEAVDLPPDFAYNAIWLLPYHSNGLPDPQRKDTYTLYKDLIVSLQDIAAPGSQTR